MRGWRRYWVEAAVVVAVCAVVLTLFGRVDWRRAVSVVDIDAYPARTEVTACASPLVGKPGVRDFRDMILTQVGGADDGLAVCKHIANQSGSFSDHADGRAWDWHAEADNPTDKAMVDQVLNWLLRTDDRGHRNAMARRMGIVYIIWNHLYYRVGSDDARWVPYTSTADPHDTHVHFSFSVSGANRRTSWWTERGQLALLLPDQNQVPLGYRGNALRPLAGDWDGVGRDTVGAYSPADRRFDLPGLANVTPPVGPFGAIPFVGDWDGIGGDEVGVYEPLTRQFSFFSLGGTEARPAQVFGEPGDLPIIGDWNGDTKDDVGTYNPGRRTFSILLPDGSVRTEVIGERYDTPVVGDWDGDGVDELGVYRPSSQTFLLKTRDSPVVRPVKRLTSRQLPVIGDWDGNGADDVGTVTAS